jgi:hypothetical protein
MDGPKEGNPILVPGDRSGEPSNRVYVRVDSVEQLAPESDDFILRFDGVDADRFDETRLDGPITEGIRDLPLAILELFSVDQDSSFRKSGLLGEMTPGSWLEIRLQNQAADAFPIDYYTNLFGDPVTRYASSIQRVDMARARKLSTAFSLEDVDDGFEQTIAEILQRADRSAFINVLDVGQGNANALWLQGGGASLYFDFGGGVLGNAKTFPKQFATACFSNQAPVLLSHWDWDHWSSGARFPQALDSEWIAPRQELGPVHRAFAWLLHSKAHLHLWPKSLPSLSTPHLVVEHCTGTDRNNSGLSMAVQRELPGGGTEMVLLPSDADYASIPLCSGMSFGAVVASHHGGLVSASHIAKPIGSNRQMVYSVGHGNSYGHPKLHALLDYLTAGWSPNHTYSTAQHTRRRPCNVAIMLKGSTPRTGCPACRPKIFAY